MSFEALRLSFGAGPWGGEGGRPSPTGREPGQMEEVDVLFRHVKGEWDEGGLPAPLGPWCID